MRSIVQQLRKWLQEEHEAKKGGPIDLSDWEDYWDDVSRYPVSILHAPLAD